jgi:hypothetical protein
MYCRICSLGLRCLPLPRTRTSATRLASQGMGLTSWAYSPDADLYLLQSQDRRPPLWWPEEFRTGQGQCGVNNLQAMWPLEESLRELSEVVSASLQREVWDCMVIENGKHPAMAHMNSMSRWNMASGWEEADFTGRLNCLKAFHSGVNVYYMCSWSDARIIILKQNAYWALTVSHTVPHDLPIWVYLILLTIPYSYIITTPLINNGVYFPFLFIWARLVIHLVQLTGYVWHWQVLKDLRASIFFLLESVCKDAQPRSLHLQKPYKEKA